MNSHAGYRLGLQIGNTREISEQLISRKLDLALVEGPFEPNSFLAEEYCCDELVPVFAPGECPPEFSLVEYIGEGKRLILRRPVPARGTIRPVSSGSAAGGGRECWSCSK